MTHIASYVTHCLNRKPWWVHCLFALAVYGAVKMTIIMLPSLTGVPVPPVLKDIPPEIVLLYALIPLFVSMFSIQTQKRRLSGQELIGQLNDMDMVSFSKTVVNRLGQWGFTEVSTTNNPCPNRNSIKMIRNGEMHLLFMVRKDLIRPRHIQEYTNILFTEGIHKGIVMTTGLIPQKNEISTGNMFLELIDGKTLLAFLDQPLQCDEDAIPPVEKQATDRVRSMINARCPLCPLCSSTMAIHLGRNNGHPGKTSWMCTRQPECSGSITFKLDTPQQHQ